MSERASEINVGFRSDRGPILIALMLSTGLVAIDSTILATAVPSIVSDLGGFTQFPWLFSIYLLAQAVTVPVYSKLSDMYGRKPIILFGMALFLLGSVLSAFAWSMPALIIFRAIQGLGAGAVQPMSITIAGDIYTVAERAKAQGYIASVWAIASVVGPTLGGLFSEYLTWRWIFIVNVPLVLIAAWMMVRNFHERIEKQPRRIDYAGATLLTGGFSLIILGLLEGGQAWSWGSAQSVIVFVLGVLAIIGFVRVERRVVDPVLPLWVFGRRLLVTTSLVGLGIGAILIGLTSYVPTYLERVLGLSPLVSGLALACLTIGWPISASQAGRVYLRYGFKNTVLIGTFIAAVGSLVLALLGNSPSLLTVALCCLVVGLGLGFIAVPSLIAAQSSVAWNERGVVTGNNLLARSLGSAIGVAIFGAVANGIFAARGATDTNPAAVQSASTAVFVGVAIAAVALIAAAFSMPSKFVDAGLGSAASEPAAG